jgi:hypothetical protein
MKTRQVFLIVFVLLALVSTGCTMLLTAPEPPPTPPSLNETQPPAETATQDNEAPEPTPLNTEEPANRRASITEASAGLPPG